MNLSVEAGYRASNPCKGVERYAENPRDPSLTSRELSRLWEAAANEERDGDKGAARIVMLIMLTGARRGEVLNARWPEFDLASESPIWKVPTEHIKGGKRRKLVITRNLSIGVCSMLLRWKSETRNPESVLFPSQLGDLYPRRDINKPWHRIRSAIARCDLRLHDLRHVFATLALGEGHSLEEIGETLGHRSAMTTRRYAHIVARQKSKVANSVSEIILQSNRS
ncbi:MAG: site-specific integrase [Verrucomicrobiaceae bacterium]|nr:MAG: site-specific integrase [Verrucomicrobiaceae bacterium]